MKDNQAAFVGATTFSMMTLNMSLITTLRKCDTHPGNRLLD